MKLITAIIRPAPLTPVLEALFKGDVRGLTISRAQGDGGEVVTVTNYRARRSKMELREKVRLDIGVLEPFVEITVRAVVDGASTPEVGDGKIFVIPVGKVYRIRTGEEDGRGDAAVRGGVAVAL